MNKRALYIILFVIISMLVFVSAYSQDEMEFVDNKVFTNPERTPSIFRHEEHNELAELDDSCTECHHIYEDGQQLDESSEDQKCVECHQLKGANGNLRLRKAYHKNCKGCHLAEKKGPIMCGECHIK